MLVSESLTRRNRYCEEYICQVKVGQTSLEVTYFRIDCSHKTIKLCLKSENIPAEKFFIRKTNVKIRGILKFTKYFPSTKKLRNLFFFWPLKTLFRELRFFTCTAAPWHSRN